MQVIRWKKHLSCDLYPVFLFSIISAMDEKIIELEKKIAYQDSVIEDLNQVVIELRAQVDILTAETAGIKDQIDNVNWSLDPKDEPPPPHY